MEARKLGVNKHGLPRHIPADVARQVRQWSGFGCVYCRSAIAQYEHIDPPFEAAKRHDAGGICLLCGKCHDKVTRGFLSKETIIEHYASTKSGKLLPPLEAFDFSGVLSLRIGTLEVIGFRSLLRINGEDLLKIEPPEEGSSVPRLSGVFTGDNGIELFTIDKNQWKGALNCWDIETTGGTITVRTGPRQIALQLDVVDRTRLRISRINMRMRGIHLLANDTQLAVGNLSENTGTYLSFGFAKFVGGDALLDIQNSELMRYPTGMRLLGGEGLYLDGAGIVVGRGAARMEISSLQIREVLPSELFRKNSPTFSQNASPLHQCPLENA